MFTDLSSLIHENAPTRSEGVAVVDVDDDGRFEFVVAGEQGHRIWKWAEGGLRQQLLPMLSHGERPAAGVAAGDFDGDGFEEIYLTGVETASARSADRLLSRGHNGRWEDLFLRAEHRESRAIGSGRAVAVVDRRGSGRYGFVVASGPQQPTRYYEFGPTGRVVELAKAVGIAACADARGLWVGPLASDRTDIVFVNDGGTNRLFRHRHDGTYIDVASDLRLGDVGESGRGVTAFDADADGRLDLCWANHDGPNRLMVRQPDGAFRDRATPMLAWPGPVRTMIAADLDNDGEVELFFHLHGEPNRLFRRTESENWSKSEAESLAEPEGLGTGAAVADVDGDGRLELFMVHGGTTPQSHTLYRAASNENHWLRVLPRTRFGAPARGATVRLTAAGRTQIRVIDGGSGYLCQMEPVAHFGLGQVNQVESVRVMWPDGASMTMTRPPIRSLLDIPYPRS